MRVRCRRPNAGTLRMFKFKGGKVQFTSGALGRCAVARGRNWDRSSTRMRDGSMQLAAAPVVVCSQSAPARPRWRRTCVRLVTPAANTTLLLVELQACLVVIEAILHCEATKHRLVL